MNDTYGPINSIAESADALGALARTSLTGYCDTECNHPDGEEPCGPPVFTPPDGFSLHIAQKYGAGIHSPGGPAL